MKNKKPAIIHSISELHRMSGMQKPLNPLVTIIKHNEKFEDIEFSNLPVALNFYNITIKKSFQGQMKYCKTWQNFDEGSMSFTAPNQIISIDNDNDRNKDGWSLLFHPDLIRQYPLGKSIKNYSFFSYGVNEALHLSDEEEQTIESILQKHSKRNSFEIRSFQPGCYCFKS